MTEPEPEPEQETEYEGSHFIPDVFCPFCNQNVKQHAKDCIGKRFTYTAKDRAENSERLKKLYKYRYIYKSGGKKSDSFDSSIPSE